MHHMFDYHFVELCVLVLVRELSEDDSVILLWTCVLVFSSHDEQKVSMG